MRRHKVKVAILILLVLLPIISLAVLSLTASRPADLGVTNGRLASCPDSPNCVCSHDTRLDHFVEPVQLSGASKDWKRLRQVVSDLPGATLIEDTGSYMHVEFTTRVFRFVDDVEFLADDDAGVIHVRSASRAGHSDLGVNRKRVERIRREFSQQ